MLPIYLGNSPTPLLFGENLKRDLDQIEFGVQFLKSKDVIALNIPFALDRFSNPVPFNEPEVVLESGAGASIKMSAMSEVRSQM